ncbi:hypothetical protein Bca4012_024029 [Brassica carinata]
MTHISDIKLIRTDTTLDLSQKAEKEGFDHLEDHNHGNRQSYGKSNNQSGFPHRNMNWRDVHMLPQQALRLARSHLLMGTSYFPASSTQESRH